MLRTQTALIEHLRLDASDSVSTAALSVLVVEPSLDALVALTSQFANAGFRVTAAENFARAKSVLNSSPPSVLVTALRLGAFNGLHLVLRGKASRSDLAALVLSGRADTALQPETESLGATFVTLPVCPGELMAAVLQTVFRRDPGTIIRPPFERRVTSDRRIAGSPIAAERRSSDRRRVLPWLVRAVADDRGPGYGFATHDSAPPASAATPRN